MSEDMVVGIVLHIVAVYCVVAWASLATACFYERGFGNRLTTFLALLFAPLWWWMVVGVETWDWLTEETS